MMAQETYSSYVNKIFFNIFSNEADFRIKQFLEQHVPFYYDRQLLKGSWTATGQAPDDSHLEQSHSFYFNKHPYIRSKFKNGELKIITTIDNVGSSQSKKGIKDFELIFSFESLKEGNKLFEQLRSNLLLLGEEYLYKEKETMKVSEIYSNEMIYQVPVKLQVNLKKAEGLAQGFLVVLRFN